MKKLPTIAVMLIAVLGCDISKFVNSNKNGNSATPKPAPTAAPQLSPTVNKRDLDEKPATPAVINTLKKSAGKYPYQLKLLEDAELKPRLQKLLGPDFAAMKANWNVETPIEIVNGVLMTSGCEQHNCGDNMYYMFIDLDKDNINVYHVKDGTQTYFEQGRIALPKKFADEITTEQ